jgi:hypothetical protein
LFHSPVPPLPSIESQVYRLIQKIERNLLEIICTALGKNGDWKHGISDAAREKAQNRAHSEGGKFPWEAYLDLADHINTITRNLDVFGPILFALGLPASRNKVKKDVFKTSKLIPLRNLASHATKRAVINHGFSNDDLCLLQEVDQIVVKIWHQAKCKRSLIE